MRAPPDDEAGDEAPERVADEVDDGRLRPVEQADDVGGHQRDRVGPGAVALPVPAQVHGVHGARHGERRCTPSQSRASSPCPGAAARCARAPAGPAAGQVRRPAEPAHVDPRHGDHGSMVPQLSKPMPTASRPRSQRLRRPVRSSAARLARVARTGGIPDRLGRERQRLAAHHAQRVTSVSRPSTRSSATRAPKRRGHAEPGVAHGVGQAATERGAEHRREARRRVDDARPPVREPHALELGEDLEEVPGEEVVRLRLLQARVDPAGEVVVGVVPAEEHPVVEGAPVVVELVAGVGEPLAPPPAHGIQLRRPTAARSSARGRRPAGSTGRAAGAARGRRPCRGRRGRPARSPTRCARRRRRPRGRRPVTWCPRAAAPRAARPRRPDPRRAGRGRRGPTVGSRKPPRYRASRPRARLRGVEQGHRDAVVAGAARTPRARCPPGAR